MKLAHGARFGVLAFASALVCGHAGADTSYVTVQFNKPALRTIDSRTFGVGTIFADDLTRRMFSQDKVWAGSGFKDPKPLYDAFKALNPGMFRFPDGTGTLHYYWNFPCASKDQFGTGLNPAYYWTPEEIYKRIAHRADATEVMIDGTQNPPAQYPGPTPTVRDALGAELVLQVNTFGAATGYKAGTDFGSYQALACVGATGARGPTFVTTILQKNPDAPLEADANANPDLTEDGKFQVNPRGLAVVAEMAGEWLRANRRKITWVNGAPLKISGVVDDGGVRPNAQQAKYWEIGNEDWDTWTPEGYAHKFFEIVTRMKEVQAGLPSAPPGSYETPKFIAQVMPGDWIPRFAAELKARSNASANPNKATLADVHAVTVHPYETGDHDPVRDKRFGALSAKVDIASQVVNIQRGVAAVKAANAGLSSSWAIWATEYNQNEHAVWQHWETQRQQAVAAGNTVAAANARTKLDEIETAYYNNKQHGTYVADTTGRMLELGVEKLFPFSASNSPEWALFNYGNGGSVFWRPRWMPAGLVVKKLINDFKGSMYPVTVSTPVLSVQTTNQLAPTAPQRSYNVKSLTAYSSLDTSTGDLRVLLVNRNVTQAASVLVQLAGNRQFDTVQKFKSTELSGSLGQTNYELMPASSVTDTVPAAEPINWSADVQKPQTQSCSTAYCVLTKPVSVQPGGVVFLTLPTKPR